VDSAQADEFAEFMLGRWSTLVRFGYGLTGDLGFAEDLAQAALIRTCAAWPRVRRAADPDAYVRRIMINSNRSRFRRRRVAEQLTGSLPEHGTADRVPSGDQRPEVVTALLSLPAGQRGLAKLRLDQDLVNGSGHGQR